MCTTHVHSQNCYSSTLYTIVATISIHYEVKCSILGRGIFIHVVMKAKKKKKKKK